MKRYIKFGRYWAIVSILLGSLPVILMFVFKFLFENVSSPLVTFIISGLYFCMLGALLLPIINLLLLLYTLFESIFNKMERVDLFKIGGLLLISIPLPILSFLYFFINSGYRG